MMTRRLENTITISLREMMWFLFTDVFVGDDSECVYIQKWCCPKDLSVGYDAAWEVDEYLSKGK